LAISRTVARNARRFYDLPMDVGKGNWPQSGGEHLLNAYRQAHGGTLYLEVGVGGPDGPGGWPPGSVERIIDAVLVLGEGNDRPVMWSDVKDDFASVVAGKSVHILEAKKRLRRSVIGMVIVGVDMFKRAYPSTGPLKGVAVVEKTDPALAWWCETHQVSVWSPVDPRDDSSA